MFTERKRNAWWLAVADVYEATARLSTSAAIMTIRTC